MLQKTLKISGLLTFLLCLAAFCTSPVWSADSNMPESGQSSMVVVDGYFKFHPGAWALYKIHDLKKNKRSTMFISTLEREERDGIPAIWMEIAITPEGEGRVVTRVLMEETPKGPGKPLEVIVQPNGMDPFTVPDSFLEEGEKNAQQPRTIKPQDGSAKTITLKTSKRKLKAIKVEAEDEKGNPVKAIVCEYIPPLGLVRAETKDMTMKLKSFGKKAKTKIKGEPMNFYLWLTMQIGKGLSGGAQGSGK